MFDVQRSTFLSYTMSSAAPQPAPRGNKFGTFGGVFTPSLLTILGVIFFLRAGFPHAIIQRRGYAPSRVTQNQIAGMGHMPHACLLRFAPRVILGTSAGLFSRTSLFGSGTAHAAEGIAWVSNGADEARSQLPGVKLR